METNELKFGVDTFMEVETTDRYFSLIKVPFGKYRGNKNSVES